MGKAPGHHPVPKDQINAHLVQSAQLGHAVLRLKCGDPGIFGRGAKRAQALSLAGIPWAIFPGVSADCAAASDPSFLTERVITQRVVLATGYRGAGEVTDWSACSAPGTTLVCYRGVSSTADPQQGLMAAGCPVPCPMETISKAQTADERVMLGCWQDPATLCNSE